MPDAKRPDPKRRSPASRPARPGGAARGRPRKSAVPRRESRAQPEVVEPIRRSITESAELRSEQRLGFTARRAAILAAVVCVLTLTIAGPVRTYFAQITERKQLDAIDASLKQQISDLQQQKAKLADPAYIKAEARERLGFVMPGEIPYQVQVPSTADVHAEPGAGPESSTGHGPWYTALWHTIADDPHGPPPAQPPAPPPPAPPNPGSPGG